MHIIKMFYDRKIKKRLQSSDMQALGLAPVIPLGLHFLYLIILHLIFKCINLLIINEYLILLYLENLIEYSKNNVKNNVKKL